ncbi:MAG: nuclear transport factor 2 family protein [Pyrinomonadaceae bacterium]
MKHLLVITVALMVMVGAATETYSQTTDLTRIADVQKLERAWLDAYEKHDVKSMTAIVGGDFVITFPEGGQQTKADILRMIGRPVTPAREMKFSTENVKGRAYGDTVILMGRVVTESMRDGKPFKEHQLYTDTYVRRNGKWQVVASHLSNVPAEPKKN